MLFALFGLIAMLTHGPHISTTGALALALSISILGAAASTFLRWFMGFVPESDLLNPEPPDIDPADRVR